ncbi:MAG: NAD-dependent epimerase/dehydratase family protein [Acidimicrobiia bacterium]
MRGIVTGGAGFIGSHLVDVLVDNGWDIQVVDDLSFGEMDRLAGARRRGNVSVHVTDIQSEDLADVMQRFRPEVVFHLAAQSKVAPSVIDPIHDAMVNVIGTLNVLEATRRSGARKIVFASSGGAIYGSGVKLPAKETAAKHPGSPYGISKKLVEDYFAWYSATHGLDYTLLGLANVYGPRQDPGLEGGVVAIFARAMLENGRITINGDGGHTRDYVYVGDVCDAFLRAADAGGGLLLNVGSGVETSVIELFDQLAAITGYSKAPVFGPPRPGDVRRNVVDSSKAKKVLGWEAWTSLESGLRKTVEWYRG